MDELSDDDLLHLAQNDDYYATITVDWECTESGCTENHSGSFDITVRGYYGNNSGQDKDTFFLLIDPTPESTRINIKEIAKNNTPLTIANFRINTTTKQDFDWSDHLFAFLSASPSYNSSDDNGFILHKVGDITKTVPYTLTVYNTVNGVVSNNSKVFNGKDSFTDKASAGTFCLDMSDYTKTSVDSFRDTYKAINYEGSIELKINQFAIPGSGNDFADVMRRPANSASYLEDYNSYIGRYESDIYYHIVYSD